MPRRKGSNTAAPPGPSKEPHPALAWLERKRQEAALERERQDQRLRAAFPWLPDAPKRPPDGILAVSLGFADPNAPPLTPAEERKLIHQSAEEQEREFLIEARQHEQMRLQLVRRLDEQEREQKIERQARQVQKLERKTQDLGERLEVIRSLAETTTGDVIELRARLAAIRSQADFGREGGRKSAKTRQEKSEAWRAFADPIILKANPNSAQAPSPPLLRDVGRRATLSFPGTIGL